VIGLSVAYIAVYVVPIFWYPLKSGLATTFQVAEYTIWGLFVLDYAVQFTFSTNRRYFLRHEWLTLFFVVFPFFRPIRAVRGLLFIRQASTKKRSLVSSLPAILVSMAVLLAIIASAAVLNAERFAPGATIKTPSDALWWSVTALMTSGGASLAPVTNEGRLIATFLLIFGLGLLTSMTGYVASWVLHQFSLARETQLSENVTGTE
jgi:voltage-gated potassium channel